MTAQPVHEDDPHDPEVILHRLPERERAFFLDQYREKATAAREPGGYKALQAFLHRWSIRAVVVSRPGYYEDLEGALEGIRNGTTRAVPIEEVFPAWAEQVATARRHG